MVSEDLHVYIFVSKIDTLKVSGVFSNRMHTSNYLGVLYSVITALIDIDTLFFKRFKESMEKYSVDFVVQKVH